MTTANTIRGVRSYCMYWLILSLGMLAPQRRVSANIPMTAAVLKFLTSMATSTVSIIAGNPRNRGLLSTEIVLYLAAIRCHFHLLADFASLEVRCTAFRLKSEGQELLSSAGFACVWHHDRSDLAGGCPAVNYYTAS